MKRFKPMYRISIFTPAGQVAALVDAVQSVVRLGDEKYDCVHWVFDNVTEYFRPLPGATPTAGQVGELHAEPSVMLQLAIPQDDDLLAQVVSDAIIPAHPWESPAIFIEQSLQPVLLDD
jgi:hypothetical protein